MPRSVAIPFGVLNEVQKAEPNRHLAWDYERLLSEIESDPEHALEGLRKAVLSLEEPPGMMGDLWAVMEGAGLPRPGNRQGVWNSIKRVWASTWNRRAYLSRKARGADHRDLHMAVLIQEVVEAEYGFVIHTVNPVSGNRGEVYAEVVLGLGETLDEVRGTMDDLRAWGVDILTIGQYLQPSRKHLPITRYYTPEEFQALKEYGLQIGFRWVESAPLVRSSYRAVDQVRALSVVHRKLYGER